MIQTFKTDLEKAQFVLNTQHNIPTSIIGKDDAKTNGMLYVNVTEDISVAIHPEDIEYYVERYEEYINELNQ
tara:strand:+ start:44 stop:259 length:216 start_codon:yes stop_codon:yes gene_type:complete